VKRARLLLGLAVLACAALVAYRRLHREPGIPARGGQRLHLRVAGAGPHYLQRDARWAADRLGDTAQTLGAVGCLVSSLAMGSTALGAPVDPGELNRRLGALHGYTREAWLVWEAVRPATLGAVDVTVHPQPSHEAMDAALARGELPVVKFFLPSGAPHWVLVVGKEGEAYLIEDPLVAEPHVITLDTRATSIVSLRVLRRAR
jgi:hypothetical protein